MIPVFNTFVINEVATNITGKIASKTKEKLQPLAKAKPKPDIPIVKAQIIVLILSPKAA